MYNAAGRAEGIPAMTSSSAAGSEDGVMFPRRTASKADMLNFNVRLVVIISSEVHLKTKPGKKMRIFLVVLLGLVTTSTVLGDHHRTSECMV